MARWGKDLVLSLQQLGELLRYGLDPPNLAQRVKGSSVAEAVA